MRPRNGEFGIYPRKVRTGKEIYYYWVYDSEGKRKFRSTGKATYEEAVKYCRNLLKKGQLLIERKYQFSDYTEKFFLFDECHYIQNRLMRGKSYSRSWAIQERRILVSRIQPYFKDDDIRDITERQIEDWILSLKENHVGSKTINHIITILKVIFGFAVHERLIEENPCEHIEPFKLQIREKGILTNDELLQLFDSSHIERWGSLRHYALNMTAALTGMRLGELLALRVAMINGNVITVANSWSLQDGLKCTKNGKVREIPISDDLSRLLMQLSVDKTDSEYIFSPGNKPMDHKSVYRYFYDALDAIGITDAERVRRNLTFHSYRHGFNTRLLESGIAPETVRLLTGHSSAMTARYSHVQLTHLSLPQLALTFPA